MRIIDADALIKWINRTGCFMHVFKRVTTDIINKQPTVVAVPVVRWKECTFHNEINCPQYYRRNELPDDWFCADGEPKQ